jgi:signal transduction histidine kinase
MNSIVQDIRDFNLYLSQSFELKVDEEVDMLEVVTNVQKIFMIQLERKNIDFKVILEKRCKPIIATDPHRLHQVLVNLISNAQKNTYQGSITVSIYRWVHNNEDFLRFDIVDTGVGINEEDHERINDLLNMGIGYQKYSNKDNGTFGFGLMISNLILQSLSNLKRDQGGGIRFKSEINVGSTFWFLIKDFTQMVE